MTVDRVELLINNIITILQNINQFKDKLNTFEKEDVTLFLQEFQQSCTEKLSEIKKLKEK